MEFIGQTILNGLMTSSFYALIAVGLSLVFGVMHIVNFAHGEFYMVGAYTVWVLYAKMHWPFFLAVAAAIAVVGLLGIISERLIFRQAEGNIFKRFYHVRGTGLYSPSLCSENVGAGQDETGPRSLSTGA